MVIKSTAPIYPDAPRASTFEDGLKFQDFVVDLLLRELGLAVTNYASKYYQQNYGESRQGIEIKLDQRITDSPAAKGTGNVSIEVAEKTHKDGLWVDSGIMRKDNSWLYVQGNYDIVFIFGKSILRQLYLARYKEKVWSPNGGTIKKFHLPVPVATKYALKVIFASGEQHTGKYCRLENAEAYSPQIPLL